MVLGYVHRHLNPNHFFCRFFLLSFVLPLFFLSLEMMFMLCTNYMKKVTIVRNEEGGNSVSTVVLRGSTDSILDDLERAVDDGVNTYKVIAAKNLFQCRVWPQVVNSKHFFVLFLFLPHQAMCRDSRIVPGGAATEIELAKRLREFSFKETG